jgi:hypothetical protein
VKIISFKMGEDPTGFISKQQALAQGGRPAEEIALEIDRLIADDDLTAAKLVAAKSAMQTFNTRDDFNSEIPF